MNKGLTIMVVLAFTLELSAQHNNLPNVSLRTIDNNTIHLKNYSNEPLVMLSFWATWCSNCIYELDEISDLYSNWQQLTKVKIIAVSIDDNRTISRVKPFLKSHKWPYEIWLDKNQKLKRAFNISDIPYTIILKKGKIIYQHSGYHPGQEDKLFEILVNASKKIN